MKAGYFNIDEYLEKLNEEKEQAEKSSKTSFMDGGEGLVNQDGIIIPDENKKSFDWLKKEFQKGKTEVKVEMKLGTPKFEPGYDLQTDLKSVKDFKPGMYGEIKTSDTEKDKKPAAGNLEKQKPGFQKGEGDSPEKPQEEKPVKKDEKPESKPNKEDIKDKEGDKKEDGDKAEVKKIDLKTKKK